MRILWIEDLGGIQPDRLVSALRDWLKDEEMDNLAEELKIQRRKTNPKAGLKDWECYYQQPSNLLTSGHEVYFCLSFNDLNELLDSDNACEFFDAVLIDIDLSDDGFLNASKWPGGIDPVRGGIWLYNRFVHIGFPPERLAFMTGNDETAKTFIDNCKENYIEPQPIAFDKIKAESLGEPPKVLCEWLTSVETEDDCYIMLRRGVLDGCLFLQKKLDDLTEPEIKKLIQFNLYLDEKDRVDSEMNIDSAREYLMAVSHTLPARISVDERHKIVSRLFLRELAHEWESKASLKNLMGMSNLQLKQQLEACGYVMKNTRNLLAHGYELHNLDSKDLAFLFLVNFRAMFNLGENLELYEIQILRLFEADMIPRLDGSLLEKKLKDSYCNVKKQLNLKINKKEVKRDGKPIIYSPHFNMMVQILALAKIPPKDFDFKRSLYIMFWQLLYPFNNKYNKYNKSDNDGPYSEYNEKHPIWIKEFSKSLYKNSFD